MTSTSSLIRILLLVTYTVCCIHFSGCDDRAGGLGGLPVRVLPAKSFHKKFGWQASDYFEDQQVIKLCQAIEVNDLEAMERLIQTGADVNATGKGNMTPLMWAFPDNQLARFTKLLEHGADPNIQITSNLNVPSGFKIGDSVTALCARSRFAGYFEAVMKAGGDPNIKDGAGMTTLHAIVLAMLPDAIPRCQLAIDHGADVNALDGGMTPAVAAVLTAGQYDLALFLLESGTDPEIYLYDELQQIIHCVVREGERFDKFSPGQKRNYQKLLDWLIAHGQDAEEARTDVARWEKFPVWNPSATARMRQEEVAKRKARDREEQGRAEAAKDGSATE